MKTVTETAIAKTAYGKSIEPISYSFTYEAFEAGDSPKPLTEEELRDFRTQQNKANARQKELQVQLDAAGHVRPTEENDPDLRVKNMVRSIMSDKSRNITPEAAEKLARQVLGL